MEIYSCTQTPLNSHIIKKAHWLISCHHWLQIKVGPCMKCSSNSVRHSGSMGYFGSYLLDDRSRVQAHADSWLWLTCTWAWMLGKSISQCTCLAALEIMQCTLELDSLQERHIAIEGTLSLSDIVLAHKYNWNGDIQDGNWIALFTLDLLLYMLLFACMLKDGDL